MKQIKHAVMESVSSVLPIAAIVLILSITIAPMNAGILVLFLFGTFWLIWGMGLFTIGSEISMKPLGEAIGTVPGKCQDRRSHERYGHSRPCRAGGRV